MASPKNSNKQKRKEYEDSDGNSVEYSSPFDVNNQIYFCGVPFRLDTYSGCTHKCKYCFVRAAELFSASRGNKGNYVVPADPNVIRLQLVSAFDTTKERESIVTEWLRHRVPIHWGGMSDPFQHAERKFRVSKKVMEMLEWYDYPTVISTKGIVLTDIAEDPSYMNLLKRGKFAVQVSLITYDDDFLAKIEPGVPSGTERMQVLEKLAEAGVWTAVRIQPMIVNSIVERKLPEFIEKLSKIGVKHLIVEAYKAPVRAEEELKFIWDLCPETIKEYQYSDAKMEGFEKILPTWRKWQYVKVVKEECAKYGITYGAADNDLRDMGDVTCCCGIENIPGFENFWHYEAGHAAKIAKVKGFVTLDDMQQFWHGEKTFPIHNEIMRQKYNAIYGKVAATPKFAIDTYWGEGGESSPECIFSMRQSQRDGKLVYERIDPIPLLEAKKSEQSSMF